MSNEYTPKPFKERKSETLGPSDYAKDVSLFLGLPIAGAIGGYLAGRLGKNKLPYFNGKPPFINRAYNKAMDKATEAVTGNKGYNEITSEDARLAPMWNTLKGFIPASLFTGYLVWQRQEGQRLDLVDVYEELKEVQDMHVTQEDALKENELLKKQLAHIQGAPINNRLTEASFDGTLHSEQSIERS